MPPGIKTLINCSVLVQRPTQTLLVKVTTASSKVQSRSHHDIAYLQHPINVSTKYQLPTSYGFRDITWTRFYTSRTLQQGERSNQGHFIMLHTYSPNQYPYQAITSYILLFLRYSPDKIFKHNVTMARSKVKSRSHYDVAHLHNLTNVHTKYQRPTPYGF